MDAKPTSIQRRRGQATGTMILPAMKFWSGGHKSHAAKLEGKRLSQ